MTVKDMFSTASTVAVCSIPWFYHQIVATAVIPGIVAICAIKGTRVNEILIKLIVTVLCVCCFPTPSQLLPPASVPDGVTSFLGYPMVRRLIVGFYARALVQHLLYDFVLYKYKNRSDGKEQRVIDWQMVVVLAVKTIPGVVALYMVDSEYFSVIPVVLFFANN